MGYMLLLGGTLVYEDACECGGQRTALVTLPESLSTSFSKEVLSLP